MDGLAKLLMTICVMLMIFSVMSLFLLQNEGLQVFTISEEKEETIYRK